MLKENELNTNSLFNVFYIKKEKIKSSEKESKNFLGRFTESLTQEF